MGSENLFHKRKAKSAKNLQRKGARRAAYKKILIVCEGEKTEPNYFEGAREYYELNTVNVEVRGDCGSDPMSIVSFAKQRYREEKDAGDPFDQIYCVFDKDGHATYARAIDALTSATPKDTYFTISSVPSFEYWLLLHFVYSTRPYTALPGNSSGNQVLTELKNYISDYEKGRRTIFSELIEQLEQAKNYAKRALQESERNQTDNPSTRVHELVEVLQNLKD
ncbi:RloB family protein [Ketobacter sp. GenoA1]|uniref:RloB family protein n=1 Tax=Ketobacter sp. GenoA1 TaxID=2072747 RepID=UPI000F1BEF3A|nr:RloB family protein [Ketobacter sp. GenoA1]RLT88008.1 MAG: RloB domain-containing protein [Ketobacter sp. GenoA1]